MADPIIQTVERGLAEIKSRTDQRFADFERQLMDLHQQQGGFKSAPAGMASSRSSLARAILGNDQIKGWASGEGRLASRVALDFDALTEIKSTLTGSPVGGPLSQAERTGNITGLASRRTWLWDFLPVAPASSSAIEFLRETGAVRVAGVQATEGSAKSESNFSYELVTNSIATIAHYTRASRQVLADSGVLQEFLRTRLLEGCWRKLEGDLLNGAGGSGSIEGILAAGNHTVFTPAAGLKPVDQIRLQIAKLEEADYVASVVVLNPRDWHEIETSRTGGSGEYDLADPRSAAPRVLWSLPIHVTNDLPVGKSLVMDAMAATIWMRQSAQLLISDSDGANFTSNLITLLAELRAGLSVTRPEAISFGSLKPAA
ncbi:MAG: phage major capsid protein [Betaproteobacteria bacterium]|nr:phage major capsid protein [Betaproteobacteria bacterium]